MKTAALTSLALALLGAGLATAQQSQFDLRETRDPISTMEENWAHPQAKMPEDVGAYHVERPQYHLTVGAEATYLVPVFSTRGLLPYFGEQISPLNFHSLDSEHLLDYDFEAAPRIWLGLESNYGLGLRSRYWEFDADADRVGSLNFIEGDTDTISYAQADSSMEAHTIDLEATYRVQYDCWNVLMTAGVRQASIFQGFTFHSMEFANPGVETAAAADFGQRFDGTGFTFALEGRRQLACCPLGVVWGARGSVLGGHTKTSAQGARANIHGDDRHLSVTGTVASEEYYDTLGIGELQAGLDWCCPLDCCFGGVFIARAMFEGQWWGHDRGSPLLDEVDFYGLTFSVGFSR